MLQAAKLVEFGPPAELLRNGHDGPFSKLIDRTGMGPVTIRAKGHSAPGNGGARTLLTSGAVVGSGPSLSAHLRAIATGAAEFSAEALLEMKEGDSTPKAADQQP